MSLIASVPMTDAIDAHTALGARRHHSRRRRLWIEIAVVQAEVVGGVLPEHRDLALEPVDGAPHVGLARQHRRVVDQVAGREVVGAIQDEVVLREQIDGVLGLESHLVQVDLHQRVDLQDRVLGALRLGSTDVGLPVDDLTLQVGLVDDVEFDDADGSDACCGEVQQRGRPEAACADHQYAGVLEPLLTVDAEVGNDQVTAVARNFFARECGGWFDQRG
jgi:hypothetical protein